jgi:hypothetical protein
MFKKGNELKTGDIFCYLNFNITISRMIHKDTHSSYHGLCETVEIDGVVRLHWKVFKKNELYKICIKKQLYYEET